MRVAPVSADLLVKVALVAAVIGALVLVSRKALSFVPDLNAINPASENNVVNQGVNALGNAIASTDPETAGRNADGSWTLGGAIYDVTHNGSFNPTSTNNYAYRGVNAIGGSINTAPDAPGKNADGSWSLGGWLYDKTH